MRRREFIKTIALSLAGAAIAPDVMARSLKNLDKNVQIVREGYNGDLLIAEDLACFTLD